MNAENQTQVTFMHGNCLSHYVITPANAAAFWDSDYVTCVTESQVSPEPSQEEETLFLLLIFPDKERNTFRGWVPPLRVCIRGRAQVLTDQAVRFNHHVELHESPLTFLLVPATSAQLSANEASQDTRQPVPHLLWTHAHMHAGTTGYTSSLPLIPFTEP